MKSFVNVAAYQLCWFLAVLGGNAGSLLAVGILVLHLLLSSKRMADLRLMFFVLFVGLLVDGILHQTGFISFAQTGFPIPFWLLVIWGALAMLPNHCFAWLKERLLLAAVLGALGGPAAYWAGVRLGGATFHGSLAMSLAILAIIWAIVWPVIMYFSVVFDDSVQRMKQGERV